MEEAREPDDSPEGRERYALDALNGIIQSGELQKAKQYCEWILQWDPFHPLFNFHLGNIENDLGNYENAKKAFILSNQYCGVDNPRILFNIGYVCFRLDEFQMSIDAYLKTLEALKKEEEQQEVAGTFAIERLPVDRVYQNLGISQSCLACTYMKTEPEKARKYFHDALSTFDSVMELVGFEARAQSPVYGPAFVNKLEVLDSLIELQDPEVEKLQAKLTGLIEYGLNSPDLKNERRDIQAILWKQQQSRGIEVPIEEIVSEDVKIKLDTATLLEDQLRAILAWHQEPVDWLELFAQHDASMRAQEQYEINQMRDLEHNTPLEKDSDSGGANREEKSPELKRHRGERDLSSPELVDGLELEEDLIRANQQGDREKNKVERLKEGVTATLMGGQSFPYAFEIMLSSPEFLRLEGRHYFQMDRLPQEIHESFTYFYQQALFYNERLTSGCLKQLDLAGLRIKQNNYMDALAIITKAINTLMESCPDFTPRFITEMSRPDDPEIQIRRRNDLIMIAKLYIHRFYYNAQLMLGLVHTLLNQDERATEAFDRCYSHIEILENILKSPLHTEMFRLIKDINKDLIFSRLNQTARECERRIPEKLKARMKCVEDFLQQDVLRVTVGNSSIPFPYDMFREGFAGINQQLNIPNHANFSDHVLSVIYLMPDGSPQISSIAFNSGGLVFDLFNMAKKYGASFDYAKIAVVNKANHGKRVFDSLEESKNKLPSLAFMRHVKLRNTFDDEEHKHSEQAYYFALDRHDPVDLITRWSQDSKGKFTPDCTVVGVISNMKSLKTGCPSCKSSAIATQNPAQDDNSAFLNRLHAALIDRGYKVPAMEPGKPQLQMVTRIRAFTKDKHANDHGLHENPLERNIATQENLAIFEKLDTSTCVSGYRNGIY